MDHDTRPYTSDSYAQHTQAAQTHHRSARAFSIAAALLLLVGLGGWLIAGQLAPSGGLWPAATPRLLATLLAQLLRLLLGHIQDVGALSRIAELDRDLSALPVLDLGS